jgi:hypothetical protein
MYKPTMYVVHFAGPSGDHWAAERWGSLNPRPVREGVRADLVTAADRLTRMGVPLKASPRVYGVKVAGGNGRWVG